MIEFETDAPVEEIMRGGNNKPMPGVYHCQVDQVIEQPEGGYIELKYSVCSPGSECGKGSSSRVYFRASEHSQSKKTFAERQAIAKNMAIQTAVRLGITTLAAYDADRTAGRSHGIEWINATGKQFIGDLTPRTFERPDGSKGQDVECNIYAIDDEKAGKRVTAFDRELLSLVLPNGPMTQQPAAQPPATAPAQSRPASVAQQQPTQQAAQATVGGSIYDDI